MLLAIMIANRGSAFLCFQDDAYEHQKGGGHRRSLVSLVNQALEDEVEADAEAPPPRGRGRTAHNQSGANSLNRLASRVSSKLEEGDFRGAVRIASSTDSFCSPDERSLNLLKEKHPSLHPDASFPLDQAPEDPLTVSRSPTCVAKAISSFPTGSAGGPDGLYPQHLKDLTSSSLGELAASLLSSLTRFINLVISGKVPLPVRPFFFGANLIGLNKPDGGIRPIAIGCTLRRLSAKCASSLYVKKWVLCFLLCN